MMATDTDKDKDMDTDEDVDLDTDEEVNQGQDVGQGQYKYQNKKQEMKNKRIEDKKQGYDQRLPAHYQLRGRHTIQKFRINETKYKQKLILSDVNVPCRFTVDRKNNKLFFSIMADENSDQSFQLVMLDLNTSETLIISRIRNGFASAADPEGTVYLGGSDGIFRFNYDTNDIETPGIIEDVDIFAMYFHDYLYFVETANQNLFQVKNGYKVRIDKMRGYGIHQFVMNKSDDILYVSATSLYSMHKGAKCPITFAGAASSVYVRALALDVGGVEHFIAQDGIYLIDNNAKNVQKIFSLENGFGIAFDGDNNIIYSEERHLYILFRS